jgi:elongation factor Ts
MGITTEDIKKLRDETGVSIMQVKQALEEAEGDAEKARIILRKKSGAIAEKKADRVLGSGVVRSYIHGNGTVGSMVELLCETDFVAKNEEFQKIAYEIAMQIAATNPEYLSISDIDEEAMTRAQEVFAKEVEDKPEDLKEKILSGKIDAYFKDKVLLTQPYIKDSEKTIDDLVKEATQKFGENTAIGRFVRFAIS